MGERRKAPGGGVGGAKNPSWEAIPVDQDEMGKFIFGTFDVDPSLLSEHSFSVAQIKHQR